MQIRAFARLCEPTLSDGIPNSLGAETDRGLPRPASRRTDDTAGALLNRAGPLRRPTERLNAVLGAARLEQMARPKEFCSMSDACNTPSDRDRWLDELCRNYDLYRERLARALCRKFWNKRLLPFEAENIAEKALAKAKASIGRFDPALRPLYVWLHMIAVRCTLDYLESATQCRETVDLDDPKVEKKLPSHPDTSEVCERKRLAERVQAAVKALPANQSAAVRLCELKGFSHEEAADAMHVPLRRLRQWLYEGRAILGQDRELKDLYDGCNYLRKASRPRKSRNRGDDGVRG